MNPGKATFSARLGAILLLLACGAGPIALSAGADAGEIPVETFFKRAEYGGFRLSPNGRYLAVTTWINGRLTLAVVDLDKRQATAAPGYKDADVLQFLWLNNERLLISAGDAQDASGIPHPRIAYAVNRDGSEERRLTMARGFSLVTTSEAGDDDIIVSSRERSPNSIDFYRLNTKTDRATLLTFDSPGNVLGGVVDRDGVVRIAHSYEKGVHTLWYRDSPTSPWSKIDEGREFRLHLMPLAFGYDNKALYVVASRNGDDSGIYVYDLQSKGIGERIAGNSQTDVYGMVWSRAKRSLLGVSHKGEVPGMMWIDPEMARLQKMVDQALPDSHNELQVADENPRRAIVIARSSVNPGVVYLLNTEKSTLTELFTIRPWIDPKVMIERKPVHYVARDGLEIPAYLTVPKSADDRKPPLVVLIHGGPFAPGHGWGFFDEAQFLASRGYAVLEPDFRGSTGYSFKHLSAGFKQWGLAMQDDITDGVQWLIKEGVVDKDRVCLFGGSYGGYATLWGLIKTPELYKCGVAYVAVTDIGLMFDITWSDMSRSSYGWLDYGAREVIGDPDSDRDKFRSVSPLYNADKLKAPLLLAYGGDDQRVPLKHGNDFRAALDRYGKTYEWVVYKGEGHGFNKDENRLDFYRRVDAFLKKNLQ